jgi:hypothetical protein
MRVGVVARLLLVATADARSFGRGEWCDAREMERREEVGRSYIKVRGALLFWDLVCGRCQEQG